MKMTRKKKVGGKVIKLKPLTGYLGVTELARLFGVNQITIRRHIQQGEIKAFKVGTRIRVTTESLKEYMEKHKVHVMPDFD